MNSFIFLNSCLIFSALFFLSARFTIDSIIGFLFSSLMNKISINCESSTWPSFCNKFQLWNHKIRELIQLSTNLCFELQSTLKTPVNKLAFISTCMSLEDFGSFGSSSDIRRQHTKLLNVSDFSELNPMFSNFFFNSSMTLPIVSSFLSSFPWIEFVTILANLLAFLISTLASFNLLLFCFCFCVSG